MKIFEREEMVREEGRAEGREEGRAEGRELQIREFVQKQLNKGKTAREIADTFDMSVETIENLIKQL